MNPTEQDKAEALALLDALMPNGQYVRSPMRRSECVQSKELVLRVASYRQDKACSCASCFRKVMRYLQMIAFGYVKFAT